MAKLDKLNCFQEIKNFGQRWLTGSEKQKTEVIEDLLALRRPKASLYPAAIHRYIVKETSFEKASDFITRLLRGVAE